jgi:hypothetical protein
MPDAEQPLPDNTRRIYQHDHDDELGPYWYADDRRRSEQFPLTERPADFWVATGRLVNEYLALQAGPAYCDALRHGFVMWLQRSPAEGRQYHVGDDMDRAALVDWYLKVVR